MRIQLWLMLLKYDYNFGGIIMKLDELYTELSKGEMSKVAGGSWSKIGEAINNILTQLEGA